MNVYSDSDFIVIMIEGRNISLQVYRTHFRFLKTMLNTKQMRASITPIVTNVTTYAYTGVVITLITAMIGGSCPLTSV